MTTTVIVKACCAKDVEVRIERTNHTEDGALLDMEETFLQHGEEASFIVHDGWQITVNESDK